MLKNKITSCKTKEPSWIQSSAPAVVFVIPLLSNPLLYWSTCDLPMSVTEPDEMSYSKLASEGTEV